MGSLLGSNLEMHLAIVAIGHNKYITLIFDKGMAMHVMRKPTLSKNKHLSTLPQGSTSS